MEEFFDICDEDGNLMGEVTSRDEAHKKGLWHRAVVCFFVNDKNEVLLQKRSANKKLWPNMWDVYAVGM